MRKEKRVIRDIEKGGFIARCYLYAAFKDGLITGFEYLAVRAKLRIIQGYLVRLLERKLKR
jgi:hypothetical protein